MLRVDGDGKTLAWGSSIWRFSASSPGAERMMNVSSGKSCISRDHCSVVRRPPCMTGTDVDGDEAACRDCFKECRGFGGYRHGRQVWFAGVFEGSLVDNLE